MAQTFTAQVSSWVLATKARTDAVFRESAQRVFNQAREAAPVDTGFLRAAFVTTLNAPATDVRFRPAEGGFSADDAAITATLAGAQAGDTVFGVFVANYARYAEYGARGRPGVGFVRRAAQNWPSIVEAVTREARGRAGG